MRVLILLLISNTTLAQGFSTKGWWSPAGAPFSPVVHKDHRITFRVKAPQASTVKLLFGEWNIKPQSMPAKLLWIGCGTDDPRIGGHQALHALLNEKHIKHEYYTIPGGHEWKVWREQLFQFMQRIFK